MQNAAKLRYLPLSLLFFLGASACGGSSDNPPANPGTSAAGSGAAGSPGTASAGASNASAGSSAAGTSSSAGASNASGGSTATGGATGAAGSGGETTGAAGSVGAAGAAGAGSPSSTKFSFFVTSMAALQALSGNPNGFGGDLRFGETGAGAGLRGADKICTAVAARSMPSNGKVWRAFLSVTDGGDGKQVNAIDRV